MKPRKVILLIVVTTLFLASIIFVIGHVRRTTYRAPRYLTDNIIISTAPGKFAKKKDTQEGYHYEFFSFLDAPPTHHELPDFVLPENPGVKIKLQKKRELYLKQAAEKKAKEAAATKVTDSSEEKTIPPSSAPVVLDEKENVDLD